MPAVNFADLLMAAVERKASDLYVTTGYPPLIRLHGEIQPLDAAIAALTRDEVHNALYDVMKEDQRKKLKRDKMATIIQTSQRQGMQGMDQALKDLVMRSKVSKQDAIEFASSPNLFGEGGRVAAPVRARGHERHERHEQQRHRRRRLNVYEEPWKIEKFRISAQ